MKMNCLKVYVWLFLVLLLPVGFVGCSDDDEPFKKTEIPSEDEEEESVKAYQDEKAYANFFAYNVMNDVYLWKQDIMAGLNSWEILGDPYAKVEQVRYKDKTGADVDKWTMMTNNYSGMVGGTEGQATGTYGMAIYGVNYTNYKTICAHVLYTYPGSPAEQAGLKRGDMILQINGKPITNESYRELFNSNSIEVGLGKFENNQFVMTDKKVAMNSVDMYEDPVLVSKVFDCDGKKVGYLAYTSFTLESSNKLLDVCKQFKQAGVTELVLDLRYNGGGYVFTENVLASMLAPAAEVNAGSVFETEIWNDEYMAYYKKNKVDLNTYFETEHKLSYNDKVYNINTADANIGLNKIYALVTENSASASESILVGLMPYMDVEVIGKQTHGKYCSGVMLEGKEWYEDLVENYKQNNYVFSEEHPEFADWKNYIKDWGIYVMISRYGDKDGNNPCMPNGLQPDVDAEDYYTESYALGDEREAMLRVALERAGKTDLAPLKSRASVTTLRDGEVLPDNRDMLRGRRIFTGDMIKPKVGLLK